MLSQLIDRFKPQNQKEKLPSLRQKLKTPLEHRYDERQDGISGLVSDIIDSERALNPEEVRVNLENFAQIIKNNQVLNTTLRPVELCKNLSSLGLGGGENMTNRVEKIVSRLFQSLVFDTGVAKNYDKKKLNDLGVSLEVEGNLQPIEDFEQYKVFTLRRNGFVYECQQLLENLKDNQDFGVMLLDLKGLKNIDNYGKSVGLDRDNGDISIQLGNYAVGQAIHRFNQELSASEFAPYKDAIQSISTSRYGGDEITVSIVCDYIEFPDGTTLLSKIQNKVSQLAKEEAGKFSVRSLSPDGQVSTKPLALKDPEIFNLPKVELNTNTNTNTPTKRDTFKGAITSSGLLLSTKELDIFTKNPTALTVLIEQFAHGKQSRAEILTNLTNEKDDKAMLKEFTELSFKNPVFRYFYDDITLLEADLNKIMSNNGDENWLETKNSALGKEHSQSKFQITRSLTEFIKYSFEPIFEEVVANATMMDKMIARGKISCVAVLCNQIKGINFLNTVTGDEFINRSVKDTIIQSLFPELNDLSTRENYLKYQDLMFKKPREILEMKFKSEDVATILFGKNGPDAYIGATDDAPNYVKQWVMSLNKVKSFRIPDTKNPTKTVSIESGIAVMAGKKGFRDVNSKSKETWALNTAVSIASLSDKDFATLKNIIEQFPETASLDEQKEYNNDCYIANPHLTNLALSLQIWSNRKVANSTAIFAGLDQLKYISTRPYNEVDKKIEYFKTLAGVKTLVAV
jgi:GGDEF domain-containing protein